MKLAPEVANDNTLRNNIVSPTYDDKLWLKEFEDHHQRKLRILHIGNIANNAYINVKILKKIGIDGDVLCYDYYHIMGCPEWEECEINEEVDHHYPDFKSISLHGYKRPDWFIQGPKLLALKYLICSNENKIIRKLIYKYCLNISRGLVCRSANKKSLRKNFLLMIYRLLVVVGRSPSLLPKAIFEFVAKISKSHRPALYAKFPKLKVFFLRLKRRIYGNESPRSQLNNNIDYSSYLVNIELWNTLFKHYDVVVGYGIDAVWPQLAGFKNYVAYEHGTIKALPFIEDKIGKICKDVYMNAPIVFSTNTDSYRISKTKLNINPSKLFPLPHAIESSKILNFYENNKDHLDHKLHRTFIAPARHHWKEGVPQLWHKGNNVTLDAIKKLSHHHNDFKVILINWGAEVALSRQYIEELGIMNFVEWIEPVSKNRLWKYYMTTCGVIDQFVTPAIGGVVFEAFALGTPVLTALNEVEVSDFFGEMPAIYNAHNSDELAAAMLDILEDPERSKHKAELAQQWFKQYHSEERILEIELEAYKLLINRNKMGELLCTQ